MKSQEIGLSFTDGKDNYNFFKIINEVKQKFSHNKNSDLDDETKEKIIDYLYEMEGYYSIKQSYSVLFGSMLQSKSKLQILFYSVILCLIVFMFISIYLALYNFFINKTLVVNIFIQTK